MYEAHALTREGCTLWEGRAAARCAEQENRYLRTRISFRAHPGTVEALHSRCVRVPRGHRRAQAPRFEFRPMGMTPAADVPCGRRMPPLSVEMEPQHKRDRKPAGAGGEPLASPRVLAIVPARAGSKGILRKNAKPFGGVPLISRAVQGAKRAKTISRVIVSTDDEEMMALAVEAGAEAPFGLRPEKLGTDTARTVDVLAHVLDWIRENGDEEPDMFVMLQPTSPFRTSADIDGAINLLRERTEVDAVVSVCEASHHPMKMHKVMEGVLAPFVNNPYGTVNRAELPVAYQENGSMYVQRVESFRKNTDQFYCGLRSKQIAPYHMSPESSIDLDNEIDWKIGEILLQCRESGDNVLLEKVTK